MIKPTELRLGNLINTGDGVTEVVCDILCDSVNTKSGTHLYDDIFPIHLTKTILKNSGFEKWGQDGWRYLSGGFGFVIRPYSGGVFHHEHSPGLEYVHTMQNYYFAICGRELPVKP